MTKQLALMRHAKSSWNNAELTDHERPLNQRGLRDAPVMGQRLAAMQFKTDKIITSTATRAAVTARIIAEEINYDRSAIELEDQIYLADPDTLIELVQETDERYQSLLMFGHNPGFSLLAADIDQASVIDNMPTCSIAVFELKIKKWSDFSRNCGALVFFDYPKNTSIM